MVFKVLQEVRELGADEGLAESTVKKKVCYLEKILKGIRTISASEINGWTNSYVSEKSGKSFGSHGKNNHTTQNVLEEKIEIFKFSKRIILKWILFFAPFLTFLYYNGLLSNIWENLKIIFSYIGEFFFENINLFGSISAFFIWILLLLPARIISDRLSNL